MNTSVSNGTQFEIYMSHSFDVINGWVCKHCGETPYSHDPSGLCIKQIYPSKKGEE